MLPFAGAADQGAFVPGDDPARRFAGLGVFAVGQRFARRVEADEVVGDVGFEAFGEDAGPAVAGDHVADFATGADLVFARQRCDHDTFGVRFRRHPVELGADVAVADAVEVAGQVDPGAEAADGDPLDQRFVAADGEAREEALGVLPDFDSGVARFVGPVEGERRLDRRQLAGDRHFGDFEFDRACFAVGVGEFDRFPEVAFAEGAGAADVRGDVAGLVDDVGFRRARDSRQGEHRQEHQQEGSETGPGSKGSGTLSSNPGLPQERLSCGRRWRRPWIS